MGWWFFIDGDSKYLATHDLTSESLVFDVGGYTGVFTDKLVKKYDPYIYVFEPVKEYYEILEAKYVSNKKVKIFRFGLGPKDEKVNIMLEGDKSSLFIESEVAEKIELRDIDKFCKTAKIKSIDLISINIEGGEYPLLQKMLKSGVVKKCKFLQVQFHTFIEDADKMRPEIIKNLLETHTHEFSFPFIWDGFKLK
jgi:FkbM family methyltransferase